MTITAVQQTAPRLETKGLSLTYGSRRVLSDLSIDLQAGEIIGLLGPNGAGKSTLLKGLAGLITPDHGEIQMNGQPLSLLSRRTRAQTLAYVAQGVELHWPMAVRDVVALGRIPYLAHWQKLTQHDHDKIEAALFAMDIHHLAGRPANQLSGGEQMRVFLARALVGDPSIIIADEPTAALDPAHQLSILNFLRAQAASGAGILVALHDLVAAARFCDRVAVLENGRLYAFGSPQEILTQELLGAVFNVEVATVRHEGVDLVIPWQTREGAS